MIIGGQHIFCLCFPIFLTYIIGSYFKDWFHSEQNVRIIKSPVASSLLYLRSGIQIRTRKDPRKKYSKGQLAEKNFSHFAHFIFPSMRHFPNFPLGFSKSYFLYFYLQQKIYLCYWQLVYLTKGFKTYEFTLDLQTS